MAQRVKNLQAMWETWVRFLDWEDPLEEGMATHSSTLAWRIPMDRVWWATVLGVTKSHSRGDRDPPDTAFGDTAASFGSGPPALQGPAPYDLLYVVLQRGKMSGKEAPASPALPLVPENPCQLPLLHPIGRRG